MRVSQLAYIAKRGLENLQQPTFGLVNPKEPLLKLIDGIGALYLSVYDGRIAAQVAEALAGLGHVNAALVLHQKLVV